MKLFKTVVILGLAILSLSSSVAFGDCVQTEVTGTPVAATKNIQSQQPVNQQQNNGANTNANTTQ